MNPSKQTIRLYTVVDVLAGVAVGAKSFLRAQEARTHLRRLRLGRDLTEDDVQIFEHLLTVPRTSHSAPPPMSGRVAGRLRKGRRTTQGRLLRTNRPVSAPTPGALPRVPPPEVCTPSTPQARSEAQDGQSRLTKGSGEALQSIIEFLRCGAC